MTTYTFLLAYPEDNTGCFHIILVYNRRKGRHIENGKLALEKNGMIIPFPQRDVHMYQETT